MAMIAAYNAYEKGHTPVTLGRAPWTPGLFLDGVEIVRAAVSECNALARERVTR